MNKNKQKIINKVVTYKKGVLTKKEEDKIRKEVAKLDLSNIVITRI